LDVALAFAFARQNFVTLFSVVALGCATAAIGEDPGVIEPSGGAAGGAPGASGGTAPATGGAPDFGGAGNASGGRASGGAGKGASAGTFAFGSGGATSTGSAGRSGGSALSAACMDPKAPEMAGDAQGMSGSFGTVMGVCYFVEGTFNNWNCSNLGGRTVTINGMPATCGAALPAKLDGGYYFDFGASTSGTDYTSFYWYTS
jgi:hypothetical protein